MVLTAIPTAIHDRLEGVRWCSLPYGFLTDKDFRTPAYGSGRVAGNRGQGVASSDLASPAMQVAESNRANFYA
jgi:hypothetical protein